MSELLPPSTTVLERRLAEACSGTDTLPVPIRSLWNPDECAVRLLPWLAWSLSVDDWDPAWDESAKRAAVKASLPIHKKKGTIGAVREALAALGYGVRVQEWFAQIPSASPYTFRLWLDIEEVGIPKDALQRIVDVVMSTKNLRSHMSEIVPTISTRAQTFVAGALGMGTELDIGAQSVTITGTAVGTIKVGTDATASGKLIISGPKAGQSVFSSETISGQYGALSIASDGAWQYTLNATNEEIIKLSHSSTVIDNFTVWSQDRTASRVISVTIHGAGDIHYAAVASLLNFTGENGSKVFLDETGRKWAGGGAIATDNPLAGASCGFFPYAQVVPIYTSDTTDLRFGESDFTVEFWCLPNNPPSGFGCIYVKGLNSANGVSIGVTKTAITFRCTGTTDTSVAVSITTRSHIAIVRKSGALLIFLNGVLLRSAQIAFNHTSSAQLCVGSNDATGGDTRFSYCGYIDAMRVTRIARYTDNFTPAEDFIYP